MENKNVPVFKYIDCIQFYVPDLQEGIKYYHDCLGLKVIWRTETSIGLGMAEGKTEIVIQNERKSQEVDIKVSSVVQAVEDITKAGGQIVYGPFDIKIGKCAVVKDLWGNEYVILDSTKGTFITDEDGNIVGQNSK
jgi:lactoylglutathione lyase